MVDPSTSSSLGLSPDGAVVTAAGQDGLVRSWQVANGQPVSTDRFD